MPKKGKSKKPVGPPVEKMHEKAQELSFEMNRFCMKDKLQRMTKENRDLKEAFNDVQRASNLAKKQQGDIQLFLNEKLDDQYKWIDTLENKLIQIENDKKFERIDLMSNFQEEKKAQQLMIESLTHELKEANGKLTTLEAFRVQKANIEAKTASLEEELTLVKNETSQQLLQLDRQHILAKEVMARDLQESVRQTRMETLAKWESNYDSNTMTAMRQNKNMTAELKFQSKQVTLLVAENKRLTEENKSLRTDLQVKKDLEASYASKCTVYQKVIHKLNQTIAEEGAPSKPLSSPGPRRASSRPRTSGAVSSSAQLEAARKKLRRQQTTIDQLRLARKTEERNKSDVISLLLMAVEDVKAHPLLQAGRPKHVPRKKFALVDLPRSYLGLAPSDREQVLEFFLSSVRSRSLALATANLGAADASVSLPPIGLPAVPKTHEATASIGTQTDDLPRSRTHHHHARKPRFEEYEDSSTFMTGASLGQPALDFEVRGFHTGSGLEGGASLNLLQKLGDKYAGKRKKHKNKSAVFL